MEIKDALKSYIKEYPQPIAYSFKKAVEEQSYQNIVKAFEDTISFVGSIVCADYIQRGASSSKVNMFIISKIRSIDTMGWIYLIKEISAELGGKLFLSNLMKFYRSIIAVYEAPLEKLLNFRKRCLKSKLKPDKFETKDALQELLKLLEALSFLKKVSLVANYNGKKILFRGIKTRTVEGLSLTSGDVYLLNEYGEKLKISPFLEITSESQVKFTNFRQNKKAYSEIIKIENISKSISQYKELLEGTHTFISKRDDVITSSFKDVVKTIETLLKEDKYQRILIESYPGGGLEYLISSLKEKEEFSSYSFIYIPIERGHLITSATVFSRLLYRQLNSLLEKPHPVELKGKAWVKFKESVLKGISQSSKNIVLFVESIDEGFSPFYGENLSVEKIIQRDFPPNIKILMTTKTGLYPKKFDVRLVVSPVKSNEFPLEEGTESLLDFYNGQRGYLKMALSEGVMPPHLPKGVLHQFNYLLFKFNFFHTIREQILRYMAGINKPVSLQKIASDLEISTPVVLEHLISLSPIVKCIYSERQMYQIFMPSFSHFLRNYDRLKKEI